MKKIYLLFALFLMSASVGSAFAQTCSEADPGVITASQEFYCKGDTINTSFTTDPVIPVQGDYYGFLYLVSTADISNKKIEDITGQYFSFNLQDKAYSPGYIFDPNDTQGIPVGTWYFTPMVLGNATMDGTPGSYIFLFDLKLDPDCYQLGKSVKVQLLKEFDPLCAGDCALADAKLLDCNEQGEFYVEVNVESIGGFGAIELTDGVNKQTVNTPKIITFGPYDGTGGANVTIELNCADNAACNRTWDLFALCAPKCNLTANPGLEFVDGDENPFAPWNQVMEPLPYFADDQGNVSEMDPQVTSVGDTAFFFMVTATDTLYYTFIQSQQGTVHTGGLSAWLGGWGAKSQTIDQIHKIGQVIEFPNGGVAELSWWMLVGLCGNKNDKFQVLLDGTEVYKIDGDDPECDNNAYQEYKVDISKYADGGKHKVEFKVTETEPIAQPGNPPTHSNFFVDNVFVNSCACPAEAGKLNNPIPAGDQLVCVAVDELEAPGQFIYLYLLSDGTNIKLVSENGLFNTGGLPGGAYYVHGLSFKGSKNDYDAFGYTTIAQITTSISSEIICAEIHTGPDAKKVSIVGINNNMQTNGFGFNMVSTYNNQTNITYTVNYPNNLTLVVYDVNGRLVYNQAITNPTTGQNTEVINTQNWAKGMYVAQLTNGTSLVSTKFTIE